MAFLTLFLVFFAFTWAVAYVNAPLWVWSVAVAAILGVGTAYAVAHPAVLVLLWLIALSTLIPMNLPSVRREWLTKPIYRFFKSQAPEISRTEQEALDSGTVWWEGELFRGRPDWSVLDKIAKPTLSEAEQAFMDGPVETLCAMIDDWQITHHDNDLSPKVWAYLKEQGFFGMIIPPAYGGLGFSALGHSTVVMKIASRSLTVAVTVMVPNSLGPAMLLLHYGTEAQKDYYLPRLAKGEEIPCFALTGPEAGSDAAALPDSGIVCRDTFNGEEILGIRLSWNKRYITLAPVATVMGLAFRLHDPNHLLGETEDLGITLALIDTKTAGVKIGRRHYPLNVPFHNGPTQGEDVFIPIDWIIGGQAEAGNGWKMLMESLADGRSISLPALSTSAGKSAARYTGAYARVREQFGQPIGHFEGVEEKIAHIAGSAYMMDAAREMTLGALDAGHKSSVASAIVKYNLTETMRAVVNSAMDIHGGSGICLGPRNILARAYQSIPVGITVEGANILTRTMIVFGQGAMRCHPYLYDELTAAMDHDEEQGLADFDRALFGHAGHLIANTARSLFLGLTRGRLSRAPGRGTVHRYAQRINWLSAGYALFADATLLLLGGKLKRMEKLSGRLADILSDLYLASAVIKRYMDQGQQPEDLPLMRWACQTAIYRIQLNFYGLFANLPNQPLAWCLRLLMFPIGSPFTSPNDQLGKEVAELILAPGPARDRLIAGTYCHATLDDQQARLEDALYKVVAAADASHKIKRAQHKGHLKSGRRDEALIESAVALEIISREEGQLVHAADLARSEVIQVDDFDANLDLPTRQRTNATADTTE